MATPLLLHACCGPCSLEPVRLLREEGFEPTICWTNPNIQPVAEHDLRLRTLLSWANDVAQVPVVVAPDDREAWERTVAPALFDRVRRCRACYALRLSQSCRVAQELGFSHISTTLAVSPYQLFDDCCELLALLAAKHGLTPVVRDFRPHYPRATRESRELGMYRQNYCGCRFSAAEAAIERHEARDARKAAKREARLARDQGLRRLMRTSDFDYNLPEELIAQAPAEPRDSCRLLVLHKDDGSVEHRRFFELGEYLEPGDLLVANRTRVLPARLIGKKPTGGVAETLLLRRREDLDAMGGTWECLVHPGKRLRVGARIEYRAGGLLAPQGAKVVLVAQILDFVEGSRGGRLVRFEPQDGLTLDAAIHAVGNVPLPPYITSYEGDPEKYQTVYAMQEEHSAAAPTAGLHFTPELLGSLREAGVGWAEVELEVGIDTFRLVEEDDPTQHVIHTERYHVSPQVVEAVRATKEAGHRVIAVGTTSVRSLESAWDEEAGCLVARENATTNLFLMPGSAFHVVDAMITNFHVPRSTLMMLVSAFATREYIMAAYEQAIANRYRMLSFGDAMLIV